MLTSIDLFPFADYWWVYLAFTAFVLLMLALDLGVFHRQAHVVGMREAVLWSATWVVLALVFNALFYFYALHRLGHDPRLDRIPGFDAEAAAARAALEFLAGYLVEKALSMDNIFVFVVLLRYFAVPAKQQHRLLFYGILGALVLRAAFIALGAALMGYELVVLGFGAVLIVSGFRMMFGEDKEIQPESNPVLRLLRRYVPVTAEPRGPSFFVREGGRLLATPLFVTLLFVEMTDIVFAFDSVPAIFGLTHEPLIVFTSNVFAILGLRALYFVLASAMDQFWALKYGLGVVLVFVGLKMAWLNRLYEGHFPITWSLAVIALVIAGSVVLSLIFPEPQEEAE